MVLKTKISWFPFFLGVVLLVAVFLPYGEVPDWAEVLSVAMGLGCVTTGLFDGPRHEPFRGDFLIFGWVLIVIALILPIFLPVTPWFGYFPAGLGGIFVGYGASKT